MTSTPPEHGQATYPDQPVLVRRWRGRAIESQHRGAWCLCDAAGRVLERAGDCETPFFVRSAVKSLQALPLIESGAAERFAMTDAELAVVVASHDAEAVHTELVAGLLARLGLDVDALRCGAQPPGNAAARAALRESGAAPTALHNNCSGKHAGFLALALHLGVDPQDYLDPESAGQRLVRQALLEMSGVDDARLTTAIDGCSAPTFRLPLTGLATAFARLANPEGLSAVRRAACERIARAVAANPVLVAGSEKRICTDIVRATGGRVFPKIGAEAVYAIGVRGADRGLAVKMDDGGSRGLFPVVVGLLERFGFVSADELAALDAWRGGRIKNWAGLDVGHDEVLV